MKKSAIIFAALAALVSCQSIKEEWQPVWASSKEEGEWTVPVSEKYLKDNEGLEKISSIAELKALYKGPVIIEDNIWIKGKVISSDQSGNIYNEMYIQDGTNENNGSAITLKLGKGSLYNEYPVGTWVYVKCAGLTLGAYNGMLQLGMEADRTSSNEYETSYINLQALIYSHIFRGFPDEPFKPVQLTEESLKSAISAGASDPVWGKIVTVPGAVYSDQIFALFYPNPNMPHKSENPENRVFLSDAGTWGITTWACSKTGYTNYVKSGIWDTALVGSGATRYGEITKRPMDFLSGDVLDSFGIDATLTYKEIMVKYASANYVSHYFKFGGTDVQVRTSGYAKFADDKIPAAIRNDKKAVSITGLVTLYNGAAQISLIEDPEISVTIDK